MPPSLHPFFSNTFLCHPPFPFSLSLLLPQFTFFISGRISSLPPSLPLPFLVYSIFSYSLELLLCLLSFLQYCRLKFSSRCLRPLLPPSMTLSFVSLFPYFTHSIPKLSTPLITYPQSPSFVSFSISVSHAPSSEPC